MDFTKLVTLVRGHFLTPGGAAREGQSVLFVPVFLFRRAADKQTG